ncbi:YeeE/YedE family protein [Ensifer adhaerens]|uniref:YeeE/YedE family protein n=1 Tax=Ensifer adhaerens TaxID=106592 RepID=UPI001CBB7142|nr:YeeE/YedE family protein [Ensifer adhaerens]MBZ7921938.1 YeeE/YedE family protein [Ensifer adhaerens]UAX94333.1 YeeE/YedE family protein [Ensifer adhaerens]UAY01968.1 YeeE/YedE family protein [Ensifer adhaerens]UAY09351.1 YeeE/YedE family protein [Ensifer adhaerens]
MNGAVFRLAATLVSGLVFGFGLSLSGMLDPARVRAFLDVTGNWNPSLAFVLGGAVLVSALGVLLTRRLKRPLFDETFHLPDNQVIDRRLIVGSAIFGVGWGLVGLCPGPALASLSLGLPATMLFVAAMVAGMLIHDRLVARKPTQTAGAGTRLSQPH